MIPGEHKLRIIGRREYVALPEIGLIHVEAKIDTGAYTSSVHCEDIQMREVDGIPTLYFTILPPGSEEKLEFNYHTFHVKKIKNSFGEMEERFVIRTLLKIGHKQILASFSLSNRDRMRYPVLIGRRPVKGRFLIDVSHLHMGGPTPGEALHDPELE